MSFIYFSKGTSLYKDGRFEEAIECYDKVIESDPRNADAYNNKGKALSDLGRYQAIRCYKNVIRLNPFYPDVDVNEGMVIERLTDYNQATKCYNNLIKRQRLTIYMKIALPEGSATVETGWIFEVGSEIPELTTLLIF